MVEDSVIMSGAVIAKGAKIKRAIIGEGAHISEGVEIDGTEVVQVVGYNEVVGVPKMKIDKYSAILGNTVGYHDMDGLTDTVLLPAYHLVENIASSTSLSLIWLMLVFVASLVSSKTKTLAQFLTTFVLVVSGACLLS